MAGADEDLILAVGERDLPRAADLLRSGANPNATDNRGIAAILIATGSNQFAMANLLLDHGASVWAMNRFGGNVGSMTAVGGDLLDQTELQERDRFVQRLVALGFPWPPPSPTEALEFKRQGQWPE